MVNNVKISLSEKQTLNYFYKFVTKNVNEIYTRFEKYNNIEDILHYSCNIIYNIFWVVFSSSKNIFITLFLLDKSILLFTEFIILSSDPSIIKDLYYIPNIIDAVIFSYKKTINSIELSSLGVDYSRSLVHTSLLIKDILKSIIIDRTNLDKILNRIITIFYMINDKNMPLIYNNIITFINKNKTHDLFRFINKIKLNKNSYNL